MIPIRRLRLKSRILADSKERFCLHLMNNTSRVSIIAAMDEKRGIGLGNNLLFKIPKDLKRMKEKTLNHPIIMGRRTFESIGRVLPQRTNIIVTRNTQYQIEGAAIAHSLSAALKIGSISPGSEEIFIFGGGQLFTQALNEGIVNRLYLTVVKGVFAADVFFPDYSEFNKIISHTQEESDGYAYTFLDLEK